MLFIQLALTVGVEAREYEFRHLGLDLFVVKDIRFHPPAISARVTGEVHENAFVLCLGRGESCRVIVLDPGVLFLASTEKIIRRFRLRRKKRFESAELCAEKAGQKVKANSKRD